MSARANAPEGSVPYPTADMVAKHNTWRRLKRRGDRWSRCRQLVHDAMWVVSTEHPHGCLCEVIWDHVESHPRRSGERWQPVTA